MSDKNKTAPAPPSSNFLRAAIESDMKRATYRRVGLPEVITRFPPEPNGYLHIGHAKSICLNFGLAEDYGGRCHLRFDDTNPTREDQEFVDTIIDSVNWLGFSWESGQTAHLYYASDYFDTLYDMAEYLVEAGYAYVDSQTAEEIAATRGSFEKPGKESPYRNRPVGESLDIFRRMKKGEFADGAHVLRAKIDMASPNMNLRDPVIYRIRHAFHHRTEDKWCIYPMYDYTHPVSDALENVTHSICTLEFQDHRPFYDWILERLAETVTLPDKRVIGGFLHKPLPHQYEFARLNLTYTLTSKRK
ncbi:MAG: glutamine--tRNA ligase, partial [Burkholderiaceae bacterium]|nr:glutamine--tRNA ligase [Burkholderiaceae bacterium]